MDAAINSLKAECDMDNGDDWWPRARPTKRKRLFAGIWLVALLPLVLNEVRGLHLLGPHGKKALAAWTLVGLSFVLSLQRNRPGQRQQALYAARTIREVLDGSGNEWAWDEFTSCSLDDPQVEVIRKRALAVSLPIDDEGRATLVTPAEESERLAH